MKDDDNNIGHIMAAMVDKLHNILTEDLDNFKIQEKEKMNIIFSVLASLTCTYFKCLSPGNDEERQSLVKEFCNIIVDNTKHAAINKNH